MEWRHRQSKDYSFKPIHWRCWDAAVSVSELLVVPESFVCCSSRQGKSLICHRPGLSAPSLRMATIASVRPRPAVPHTNIALYGQWFNRLWRHSSAPTLVNLIVRSAVFAEICMWETIVFVRSWERFSGSGQLDFFVKILYLLGRGWWCVKCL